MIPIARPYKDIDKIQFEKLCALQCTQEEICDFFDNADHKTLESWCERTYGKGFSQVFAQKRTSGRVSLRRNQMKLSETSAAMAIFLGKQYLGQSDNPSTANTSDDPLNALLGDLDEQSKAE